MAYGPCLNPNCKSHGKPHPGCKCHDGNFAEGGEVGHFCDSRGAHLADCKYYADGGEVAENQEFHTNPALAVDHHILHHGLHHTLTKTGHSKSPDGNKHHQDFMDGHSKGVRRLAGLSDEMVGPGKTSAGKHDVEGLKGLVDHLHANPEAALNAAGQLGQALPDHALQVQAKLAAATNYLQSIKPQGTQPAPLDKVVQPSAADMHAYDRQVAIVQDPSIIYRHAKDGRLQDRDLMTLQTVYPELKAKMAEKAFETLTKHKDGDLDRVQLKGLSQLVGAPLSFIQTPGAAQAIMKANSAPEPQQTPNGGPKKASAVELKEVDKNVKLSETPLQSSLMNRKS